ncbi:MAG: Uma2 family endonuclease [Mycobacteriales bacterium]
MPDVVVADADAVYRGLRHLAPADVLVVVEVVFGSSGPADRRWKPEAYAEAGVGCYWRVELAGPPGPEVMVYGLQPGGYVMRARGSAGALLYVDLPFAISIDPGALIGAASA